MPSGRTLKSVVAAVAALLLLGSSIVLAAGGGAPPKKLTLACATNQSSKLQYVSSASDCPASRGQLVRFPQDAPVVACQLDKPNPGSKRAALPPPAHRHNVPGMLFKVSSAGKCHGPRYPNSHAVTLPKKHDLKLCAGQREGTIRVVTSYSSCNDLEFAVVLAAAPNHPPTANDKTVNVAKNTAKPITLTGSDPDGDSLSFSIVKSPAHGTLTGSPPHVVYHPAPNFSGLDSFKFKVADGRGGTDVGTVSLKVGTGTSGHGPVVTTTAGSTPYKEGDPATAVDGGLTLTDSSSTTLSSARVAIAAGRRAGDQLEFANQNGIAGSYDSTTGVLALTGSSSVAHYQAALRSVAFRNSGDDPGSSRTVSFQASDGSSSSNTAMKNIAVTPVNDAPALHATASTLTYNEGDGAVAVDPGITASDPDSANLSGASVAIASHFHSTEDSLAFTNQNGISGSYDSGTGVLTLSGSASVAHYQTALRSITYSNSSSNPSSETRTVSFQVTDDGAASSNTASRDIAVVPGDTRPTVTTSSGATAWTEGDPAKAIDGALTVTDPDDTNLESARVRISSGFQSGDQLQFTDTANISGNYDSGTGVLTLTGTDTVAAYQSALQSVKFTTTNDNPSTTKTIEFKANDGDRDSNLATKSLAITPVNDAPSVSSSSGSAAFSENGSPVAVDPNVAVSDPDSTDLSGAKVQISSNFSSADGDTLSFANTATITGSYNASTGVLTLSGTDTVANYQAALRSVTYSNTSDNPSTATRTVGFTVTDGGAADSNTATRDVTVAAVNDAPVVTTTTGATPYTEGTATPVDSGVTVSDADSANLTGATVRFKTGFETGDQLLFTDTANISGNYDSGTGVLTLSGTDTVAAYQAALRSVEFNTTNDNPSGSKSIGFSATDGSATSNESVKGIDISGVNDAPTVNTSSGSAAFSENGTPATVDPNLTVSDPDSTNLSGAKVQISSNFSSADGDTLSFTDTATITGSYNSSTGVLTLSGTDTVAHYQTALRSVTFSNPSDNPSGATRTVSFTATDDSAADSNIATRDVTVTPVNDAPVVTTTTGATPYTEGTATPVDASLTVSDADNANLTGATVRVKTGFQTGDQLPFTDTANISGNYDSNTGVLTLSGTDTVANYQAALRSIKFNTTNDNPSSSKTIGFVTTDGVTPSSEADKALSITGVNDAPTVGTSGGSAAFTENGSPATVDPNVAVSDPDSTNLSGAKVQISTNFSSADGDTLSFTDTATITGSYNASTGILTLSGTDTVANYQAALRSITFSNTSANPSSATRTVSFTVTDSAAADSNTATRDVTVTPVDDAPVVTTTSGSTPYTEGDPPTTIDSGVTVADADDTNLTHAQVRISSGFQTGDVLQFTDTATIIGTYTPATGVLSLDGTDTVANYQAALRSVKYLTTNPSPSTAKTIGFTAKDATLTSSEATKDLEITPVNSPPDVTTTSAPLAYTENDPAKQVDPGLSVTEPEGDPLTSASASITSNFQSGEDALSWTDNNALDTIVLDVGNSTNQTIALTGPGTAAEYQAALQAVKYTNSSENPSSLTRTVTFSATDVGGATGSATRGIAVTPVDDSPVAVNDSATVLEDSGATAVPVLTNDIDVDGGPKSIASVTQPANGTVVITGGGTGLTYSPSANYCNDPTPGGTDDFTYTLTPGGSTATVHMTVTCVNDAPVAADDTFNATNSAVGNTTLNVNDTGNYNSGTADGRPPTPDPTDTSPSTDRPHKEITGDILANDTDVDTAKSKFSVTPGTFATNDGGTVTIQSDGDFNFEPAPSTSCTDHSDFFDYTLNDNDPSGNQTDTGRVTINITGCVWYVNNNDAQGNSGTSEKPFDTLAQAQTASSANDTIFVYDGDDTTTGYNAGISLKSGQTLVSEAADLIVGSDTLHSADAANKASLTNNNADVVSLNNGTTVRGFNIDPQGTGGGICGGTACGGNATAGSTLDDLNIVDNGTKGTQPGLELNGSTGTFNISNLTVNNGDGSSATTGDEGVKLNNAGTVNFASTGTISLTTNGAAALDASAGSGTTSLGSASTFDDITVTNSGNGGVSLNGTTGSGTAFGDGSGNDLQLTTVSGSPAAFSAQTAGSFSVPSAGQSDVSATGGPAVDVVSSSGSTMAFDGVSSTNSANDGVNIDSIGTGTFSATSGTIGGEAGIGFDLNAGSGSMTYPGTFNNGSGPLVAEVTGRTGGVVSLSGNMNDTNDAGGGINESGNTGGSTVYSGATKQFNTGASDALTVSNPDGSTHTAVWSGGGTAVTTTSGNGVKVTGVGPTADGNIQFSGTGNTIDSTALGAGNRALTISDSAITATGVTFDHINSSGGVNGIKLVNTGNTAGLTVNGTGSTAQGGDASGGTIKNTTARGIDLANTNNLSLNDMTIDSTNNAGIYATGTSGSDAGVTNFSFTHGTIQNAGDGGAVNTDNGISFNNQSGANTKNVDGTLTVTNDKLLGNYGGGVTVAQNDGTISNADISSNLITQATTDSIDAGGIQFSIEGTSSAASALTKGTFNNNTINNSRDNGIVFGGGNTTTSGAPGTSIGTSSGDPSSLGTNKVTISGNTIAGDSANKMNSDGILVGSGGKGTVNAEIINNPTISNLKGEALGVGVAGAVTGTFKVDGNSTTPNNIAGNDAIGVNEDKRTQSDSAVLASPTLNAQISSNTVGAGSYTGYGIHSLIRDTNGTANVRISNNNVAAGSAGNFVAAIEASSGSSGNASFNPTACYDITSNTAAQGADNGAGNASGIIMDKLSSSATTYKFGIVGLSPSPATAAQAETFVGGNNPASATGTGFYAGKRASADNGSNFTSCTLPFP